MDTPRTQSTPVKPRLSIKSRIDPLVQIPPFKKIPDIDLTPMLTPILKSPTPEKPEVKHDVTTSVIPPEIKMKFNEMTVEEQHRARGNLMAKFELLKESWKNYNIPQFTSDTSLEEIYEAYETYVKNIKIHQNTDKYKMYIVIFWLFIEGVCVHLGLNISGYTISQLKIMNQYETLLIKLGEKNYSYHAAENQWPVEFDLLFMALLNAIVLIIIKMLCDWMKLSDNMPHVIMEALSSHLSGTGPQPSALFSDVPKPQQFDLNSLIGGLANGNLDLSSILANIGSNFIKPTNKPQPDCKTPKFGPAYED